MSESVIEKVARAIASALKESDMAWDSNDVGAIFIEDEVDPRKLARVAIEAMREPTEAMRALEDIPMEDYGERPSK